MSRYESDEEIRKWLDEIRPKMAPALRRARAHPVVTAAADRAFPPLFAQLNRAAHGWLFTDPGSGQGGNQWVVDVAPMLKDRSFQDVLSSHNVKVPANLTVPLTVSMPTSLRQGRLSRLAAWGPWVSVGAAALAGLLALLTLAAGRRRGKALTARVVEPGEVVAMCDSVRSVVGAGRHRCAAQHGATQQRPEPRRACDKRR